METLGAATLAKDRSENCKCKNRELQTLLREQKKTRIMCLILCAKTNMRKIMCVHGLDTDPK